MICPASSAVERLHCRQRVGGSNPSPGSVTFPPFTSPSCNAAGRRSWLSSPATTAANNLPPACAIVVQRNCRRPATRYTIPDGGSFIASGGALR